jgi:hypothetical protein
MLSRHVSVARAAMETPWDSARAARVLDRALAARRTSSPRGRVTAVWTLVLAGASLAAAFVAFRPVTTPGEAPGEPRPAVVSKPSDALDGGKHTG